MIEHIERSLRTHRLWDGRAPLLVAVSGGVDSMVLLDVLRRLAAGRAGRLVVAHFNHRLRGRSSDADEAFVRRTAARFRLSFLSDRADVRKFADERGWSVEMAARQLRHEFLARAARAQYVRRIALAHHADDQIELFFLRLFRGAGAGGLAGMDWKSSSPSAAGITLVRPLLDQPKSALLDYARAHRIRFREDASNTDRDIQRNRIRHELIPLLERRFQPALAQVLRRQMDILGAESDFVEASATGWRQHGGVPFAELPLALQRRVLQQQLHELGFDVDFGLVEHLRTKADQPVTVRPGLQIVRNALGVIQKRAAEPAGFDSHQRSIDLSALGGKIEFDSLRAEWRIGRQMKWRPPSPTPGCERFDADQVGTLIILRHWRPGDRFQPIGLSIAVKLQDLFTNLKVPSAQRHQRVVAVTAKGEIWWVEGLRIGERFKLRPDTRRQLEWRWNRNGGSKPKEVSSFKGSV